MSVTMRVLLFVAALVTLMYVLWKLRKERMPIQASVFWILFAFVIVLLAVFPQIAIQLTRYLGVVSPANFIYLVFIFFAYNRLFVLSTKNAHLEGKIEAMAYTVAMLKKAVEAQGGSPVEGSGAHADRHPDVPADE